MKYLFLSRPLNVISEWKTLNLSNYSSVFTGKMDVNTMECIQEYYRRWKSKTIFQVLLMYRAAKLQELAYFAQQVSYDRFGASEMYRTSSCDFVIPNLTHYYNTYYWWMNSSPSVPRAKLLVKSSIFIDNLYPYTIKNALLLHRGHLDFPISLSLLIFHVTMYTFYYQSHLIYFYK